MLLQLLRICAAGLSIAIYLLLLLLQLLIIVQNLHLDTKGLIGDEHHGLDLLCQ